MVAIARATPGGLGSFRFAAAANVRRDPVLSRRVSTVGRTRWPSVSNHPRCCRGTRRPTPWEANSISRNCSSRGSDPWAPREGHRRRERRSYTGIGRLPAPGRTRASGHDRALTGSRSVRLRARRVRHDHGRAQSCESKRAGIGAHARSSKILCWRDARRRGGTACEISSCTRALRTGLTCAAAGDSRRPTGSPDRRCGSPLH